MVLSNTSIETRDCGGWRQMEKLPINFDITFPNIPCHMLSLDVMDESGQHISNYEHDVFKVRLDEDGKEVDTEKQKVLSNPHVAGELEFQQNDENYCGPCYGANTSDDQCCNTCEQVKEAYAKVSWAFKPNEIEQCLKEGIVDALGALSKGGCRMHGHLLVNKLRGNFHSLLAHPLTMVLNTSMMFATTCIPTLISNIQ
ncbi:unnamed protein product [Absidia cylindrospora]